MEQPTAGRQKATIGHVANAVVGEREAVALSVKDLPANQLLDRLSSPDLWKSSGPWEKAEVEVPADYGPYGGQQLCIVRELIKPPGDRIAHGRGEVDVRHR